MDEFVLVSQEPMY